MKNSKKRLLALLLAVSMVIPNVSYVNADEATPTDAKIESEQESPSDVPDTEYIIVDGEGNVVETTDTSEENSDKVEEEPPTVTDDATESVAEDVTTEDTTEEKTSTFATEDEGVDVSGIDFSSRQLLVGTEDESIFTWDTIVVSGYNGIYLTEYATVEETRNAYTYYYNKADFVDANITFTVSDNEGTDDASEEKQEDTADLSEINTGDDALSNLNDMDTTGEVPAGTIAVIDTGINAEGLVDSVSVIGESASDDNGHGTRMFEFIKAEYPDARILSIKALGSDGKGQVSDVYAAIQYAIEKKVSVINLSISAYSTAESDVIRTVIEDAVAQGIVVVGAAGNDGKNVRYFIPGNIDSAVIVGASDGNGQRIAGSNYGSTIDYNVEADSTSEAAAKMSAIISRNGGTNTAKIFTTDYSEEEETGELITYENSEFVIANWPGEGESHTTTAYIVGTDLGSNSYPYSYMKYKYYDSENHLFDTGGLTFDFSGTTGSISGVNCFCIDPNAFAGNNGYEFDTDTLVEITAISPAWVNTTLTTQQIQNIMYWAMQEGGTYADDFSDYFIQYWLGRSSLMGDVADNSDYYNFANNHKNTAIPNNYSFKLFYIHNTAETTTGNHFQDYLTWKLDTKQDYYVAVRKVDQNGRYLNHITFKIKVNGTELYHRKDSSNYISSIYTGFINKLAVDGSTLYVSNNYEDFYGKGIDGNSDYIKDGVALIYLGKFETAPTVQIAEWWTAGSATSERAYQNGDNSIESVTYPGGTRTTENVPFSKFNTIKESSYRTVTARTTINAALADANNNSNIWTNDRYEDYYIAVRKVDGNGYLMNGITFDVTVNGTKQSKQIETGKDYNGSAYVNGSKGIGGYYLGRFSTAPTVSVKENWTETWNKNHFVHDTSTKSPALKTSMADAKNNAAAYTYTNYSYGFATMHKESTGTVLSMDGIQYKLYRCINGSGTAVNTLIATVTLNANGYIKSVSLSDSNCWQETIDGVICIGGLTYNPEQTTPITNNYYWVESQTNDNYELNTTKYYITVNKSNATKPGTDDTKYPSVYTFTPASATGKDNARAYVGIYKKDEKNRNISATFDIYGTNSLGATSGGTKIGSFTTSASNGKASYEVTSVYNTTTTNVNGKYRYFYAVETHTDANHVITVTSKALTVHAGTLSNADYTTWTNPSKVYAYLNKQSSNPDCTDSNPNYDLKGAEYKVFTTRAAAQNALNINSYTNAIATLTVQNNTNGKTNTINVSDYMNKNSTTGLFENTNFFIVESKAGKNYLRSTDVYTLTVTPSNDSSNPAHISVTDEPVNDPFNIEIIKTDAITGSHELPEGKSLAGAKFRIDFYAVDVTQTYTQTQLETTYTDKKTDSQTIEVKAIKQADNSYRYIAQFNDTFPLGYITVTEVKSPKDYSLTGAKVYLRNDKTKDITGNLAFVLSTQITSNGTDSEPVEYHPLYPTINLVNSTGAAFDIRVDNTPIRGDIKLTKVTYANGTPLKNVEFVITNTDTGEEHSIFTDAKGNATTKNNASAWFSKGNDNKVYPYKAGYGSLPTGHYTIKEKRGRTNSPYQLLKEVEFEVKSNALLVIAEADGKLYNIEMPEITTTARVVETDSKTLAQMGEPQTIEDVVAYKNLRADTTYTLVGRLMVRHPDGTYEVYKKNGTAYTVKKTFTTGATWTKSEFEKSGTVTVNYEGIYAENYEGCSFVVFEKLYLGTTVPDDDSDAAQYPEYEGSDETIFPVVHEDIDDEGQTVRPVDIHTTIADAVTDDHIAKSGDVTVTDRVYFTGLTIDEYYTIKGTLHVTGYSWKDADGNLIKTTTVDGEELLDADGNPVTAEKTFKADSTDGYVDLEFTFDASLLEGESVVAFESLYYKDREIAVHADISDEDETVHFPKIHTTLYKEGTGEWAEDYDETDPTKVTTVDESSKEVMAAEEAVVVDRIKYHNLIAGRSYVVKGILIDKVTGEPLLDANGDKIEVEQKFTLDEVPEENITASPDAGDYILADGTVLDMSADHSIQLVDGYFEVTFPAFDASEMGNKKAVAYEEVYLLTTDANGDETEHLVAEHKDKDDVDQTVHFVEIHTNANVEETESKIVPIEGPVTINDTVTYKDLIPGKEYTLTARPVVKGDKTGTYKDGNPLLDVNGKEVVATITFIPDEPDGEIVVPITFEGYLIPETSIVCYEDMTNDKGLEIAVHNDINDEDQTTYVVDISTTARGNSSADNEEFATEETVIIDTVSYSGLEVGREYRVSGTLMDKETGKELLGKDGKPVTAETTFKAEAEEGTIDITFPAFDGTTLAGKDIVVFEKLYIIVTTIDAEGKETFEEYLIAEHEDLDDEGQTVHLPEIKTTAVDKATGDSVARVSEEVTIVDTVTYTNLTVGNTYTVKGVLMVKETGKELLDADGKPVTAETTFKAEKPDGTIDVVFTFDSSLLEGETLVVFEDLYREDIHVATHSDIEDEDQTIRFPKVKTKAEDAITKENIGEAGKETTIIDTVYYWNLIVGKEYTVKGVLMNQATGEELLDASGEKVTAEKTFTAETEDGTVELTFTFDGSLLAGETVIVFEDLYHNDIRVDGHTDITDEDQSEHHPGIKTRATDRNTGEQVGYADKTVTIVDEVSYTNLIVGKKYTVKGTLMDRDTGAVFLVDGKPVTAEKTFTAEKPDGVVELEFTFDGYALRGTVIVVFEDLFYKGKRVATHADLTDKDQTVYYPAVQTHVEDQTKRVQPVENVTVVDDVMYSKLKIGERYQLVGVLVDKKTGKNIVVDNTPIKATKVFTAEAEDGMITMEFHFDATGLEGDVTVFEYLSLVKDVDNKDLNYYLVAEHTDLNDTEQTFVISPVPKTGDDTPVNILFGLLFFSGLGLAFMVWRKRRKYK